MLDYKKDVLTFISNHMEESSQYYTMKRIQSAVLKFIRDRNAEGLKQYVNGHVTELDLCFDDQIGAEGIKCLSEVLRVDDTVTKIILRSTMVKDEEFKFLSEALKVNNTVTCFYICGREVEDERVKFLSDVLQFNKTITQIGLRYSPVGVEGIEVLSKSLKDNKIITKIDLTGSKIGYECAKYISEVLRVNKTIVEIVLSRNNIRDIGVKCISEALGVNRTVANVDLSSNNMEAEGMVCLSEMLRDNKTITQIDLSGNHIYYGLQHLCETLKVNDTITKINLSNFCMNSAGLQCLSQVLQDNKTITQIDLSCNYLSNDVKCLSEALKVNEIITEIKLYETHIGEEGARYLLESLQVNTVVQIILRASLPLVETGSLLKNKLGYKVANEIFFASRVNGFLVQAKNGQNITKTLSCFSESSPAFEYKKNHIIESLDHIRRQYSDDPKTLQKVLLNIALLFENQKAFQDSLKFYQEEWQLVETIYGKNDDAVVFSLRNISRVLDKVDRDADMGQNFRCVAEAYYRLGKHNAAFNHREAVYYYGMALKIFKQENIQGGVVNTLKSLVEAYKRVNNHTKTIECYKELLGVYKNSNHCDNDQVTSILEKIKDVCVLNRNKGAGRVTAEMIETIEYLVQEYRHVNNHEKAIECYKELLVVYGSSNHCGNNKVLSALEGMRDVYIASGHQKEAGSLKTEIIKVKKEIAFCNDFGVFTNKIINNEVKNMKSRHDSNDKTSEEKSEDIKAISQLMKEGSEVLKDKEDNVVLLLGETGAGKSTLANIMCGRNVEVVFYEKLGKLVIATNESNDQDIFRIAHGAQSETRIPNKSKVGDVVIYDCPGFSDSEGGVQEIVNAFYVQRLFENATYARCVLVVSASDITEKRGKDFVEVVEHLVKVFNDIGKFENSMSLVMTHAPSGMTKENIKNCIDEILKKPKISDDARDMMEYLSKSIHSFFAPSEEGEELPKYDFLQDIVRSGEYLKSSSDLANIAVSEESVLHARDLLETSLHKLKAVVGAVVESMDELYVYIEDGHYNNQLINAYSELVKPCIPSDLKDLDYNRLTAHDKEEHLLELDELLKLKKLLSTDDATKHSINTIMSVLEIMEEFVLHQSDFKTILQHYAYVIKQQMEHVKFFASICSVKVNDDFLQETIIMSCKLVSERLLSMTKNIPIVEYHDPSYYEKAIEYLDMFLDHPECQKSKAEALRYIGDIYCKKEEFTNAVNSYVNSIKYDKTSGDTYYKIGNILFDQGKYAEAIKFFTVVSNTFLQITQCYKNLINQKPDDADLRMDFGRYYESCELHEKAKKHYEIASSLRAMSQSKECVNLDSVNPEDLCNLVGADEEIVYVE